MNLAALSASLIATAEDEGGHHVVNELPIEPWVVGAITLSIFMLLLIGLFIFGSGREHS